MKVILNNRNKFFKIWFLNKILNYDIIGFPSLISGSMELIIDKTSKVFFSKNSIISNGCELRSNNNGYLHIGINTKIDNNVRIISNNSKVLIGNNVKIGIGSILNGGGGITIGDNTSLYGYVYILTSTHLDRGKKNTSLNTKYIHKNVIIGNNVIIKPFCIIDPGKKIKSNYTLNR